MALVVIYFVCYAMVNIFSCIPIDKDWNKNAKGTCINTNTRTIVTRALNLALDVLVVALPMPVIWRLQMTLSKRLIVSAILGAGLV